MFTEPPSKLPPVHAKLTLSSVPESDLVPVTVVKILSVKPNTPDATHVLVDVL